MLVAISGSQGSGKAQPTYSKILTPSGWTTFGDIQTGDEIITPSGNISRVVGVFPQGKKEIFEVTVEDGSTCHCCGDHLWMVYFRKSFYVNKTMKVDKNDHRRTSSSIINQILTLSTIKEEFFNKSKYYNNVYIPLINEVDFTPSVHPIIPPYLLGVLLGDGYMSTLGTKGHPLSLTNIDEHILTKVQSLLQEDYHLQQRSSGSISYNISGKIGNTNIYKNAIDELKLSGTKSHTKFIPREYLLLSYNDRLALLQGLLDTDGTVGKKGDISLTTVSNQLSIDTQELVRSLGGKTKVSIRHPFYIDKNTGEQIQGKKAYEIRVTHKNPKSLFTLPRKIERCNDGYYNGHKYGNDILLKNKIIDIQSTNTIEEAVCIKIDSPDELYITDNYIVTHNTTTLKALKEKGYPTIERKTSRSILTDWGVTLQEVNNDPDLTVKFQDEITKRKYDDESKAAASDDIWFTERTHTDLFTYALVSLGKDNEYSEWLEQYHDTCKRFNSNYSKVFYLTAGHFNIEHDGVRGSNQHYSRMVDLIMLDFTKEMVDTDVLKIIDTPDLTRRVDNITWGITNLENKYYDHRT